MFAKKLPTVFCKIVMIAQILLDKQDSPENNNGVYV